MPWYILLINCPKTQEIESKRSAVAYHLVRLPIAIVGIEWKFQKRGRIPNRFLYLIFTKPMCQ